MSRVAVKSQPPPSSSSNSNVVSWSLQKPPQTNFSSTIPAVPSPTSSPSPLSPLLSTLTRSSLLSESESKEFKTRFKAAQKSPHLVEIQIKTLDNLIAFLKQKRDTAGRIIRDSLDEIKQIEMEEKMIHIKLDPLADRIELNSHKREQLLEKKSEADQQLTAMLAHTSGAISKTQHKLDQFKQQQLRIEMAAARKVSVASLAGKKGSQQVDAVKQATAVALSKNGNK